MKRAKVPSIATIIAALFLCITQATGVFGAGPSSAQQNRLQSLAETLQERARTDRMQAARYAAGAGIPTRRELPNGRVLELQRIGDSNRDGRRFRGIENLEPVDVKEQGQQYRDTHLDRFYRHGRYLS